MASLKAIGLTLLFVVSTIGTFIQGVQGLFCCKQYRNGTDCAAATSCADGELCYHEVLMTDTGDKIHQLGCRSGSLCAGGVPIGKRGSANVLCTKCCDQPFCNIPQCNTASCSQGDPCKHGQCFMDTSGSLQCTCDIGYTGTYCDQIEVCHPNPCVHGLCVRGTSGYTCVCNHGYSGDNCQTVDPCDNLCVHGTCFLDANRFGKCNCDIGYKGTNCELKDVCHPNPCKHGTCKSNSSGYACMCNHGYTGSNCDKADVCAQNPCLHGVCSTSISGWHCTCDQGYNGRYCDIDTDECASSPCSHGVCYDHVNSYTCNCFNGYTGNTCDQKISAVTPCSPNPCVHGNCTAQGTGYTCMCNTGYTGTNCSRLSDPCVPNPCKNGKCVNPGVSYICLCNIGYAGNDCDKELRDCKDVLDNSVPSVANNNIYTIKINTRMENVLCDMTTAGGGWTVLMNRESAQQEFMLPSTDYELGFGTKSRNFWIGLKDMHDLTYDGRRYQLRVDLTSANGTKLYETYDDFSIGPPPIYTLHIGSAFGNAGDSLRHHNGYGFTTSDVDRDSNKGVNCANYIKGAWWFYNCYDSCLTCPYVTPNPSVSQCSSMSWNTVGYCEPLKTAKMMIRPI